MSETTQNNPQEIDLIQLFTNIGNWIGKKINWAFNIALAILYFFVRNSIWFIIVIIIGLSIGFIAHRKTPNYYKTQLIGFSHTISNIEVIKTINNWNYLSSFTEEEIKNIKTIGASYVLDINNDGKWDDIEDLKYINSLDTNIMKNRLYGNFCIIAEVYDTSLILPIKVKVLDFLSNNQRVIERNIIRLKQQEELLPKIRKEINDLDSLKFVEYFGKNKPVNVKMGEVLLLGEKETKLYHNEILSLYQQQQSVERNLFLNPEPFEVLLDFSIPNQEENNLFKTALFTIKISLLIGFFVILFIDQRKFFIEIYKKAKKH
jgi:hypothetical protein